MTGSDYSEDALVEQPAIAAGGGWALRRDLRHGGTEGRGKRVFSVSSVPPLLPPVPTPPPLPLRQIATRTDTQRR